MPAWKLKAKASHNPNYFFRLFRFTTKKERLALFFGVLFAILAGTNLPLINIMYAELTNIVIDRQFPTDKPSSKTVILEFFGGGEVLINASKAERMKALEKDMIAFASGALTVTIVSLLYLALSVFIFNYVSTNQVKRIKIKLFQTLLSQSSTWFDLKKEGNFTKKITQDLSNVQKGIGERIAICLYQMSTTVLVLGSCFYIGWLLTTVLLICLVPMFVIFWVLNQVQSNLTEKEISSAETAADIAEEVLYAVRTVIAYGAEEKEIRSYAEKLKSTQTVSIKKALITAFGVAIIWTIVYGCYAISFSLGFRLILWNDNYNPTVLISVFFGVLSAATIISYSGPYWESMATTRSAAASMLRIIGTESDINPFSSDGDFGDDGQGPIEFKNVHFHYPSRPEKHILKGLNFKVNPTEKVAIIGATGSGKSTIFQLIPRFYDPVEGEIFLGGVNLKKYNISWLRRQMAIVFQDPVLFTGTVSENIAFGLPDTTEEEIEEAADIAQAHEFIRNLPEGYHTMLDATSLSGGQKQRIALARALVRKPKILLLDDVTSALNTENVILIRKALRNVLADVTCIIVTQNPTFLSIVDRIIVLDDGRIAEEGTLSHLADRDGVFNRLLKTKAINKERPYTRAVTENWKTLSRIPLDESMFHLPGTRGAFVSDYNIPSREVIGDKAPDSRFLIVNCYQFLTWNRPHWPFLYFGILSSVLIGCSLPILVILFGELVGLLSDVRLEKVYLVDNISLLISFIGLVSGLLCFIQTYFLGFAAARLGTSLRVKTFKTILSQEMAWFDSKKNKVSTLCHLLNNECTVLQSVIGSRVGVIIQGMTALLMGTFISFYYSIKLTLVTIAVIPLIFCGIIADAITSSRQIKKDSETGESERKIATEALNNMKVVNSLGCESYLVQQYSLMVERSGSHIADQILRGIAYSIGQSVIFFGYIVSLTYGVYLIDTEDLHYKNVIKVSELIIYGCWVLGQALVVAPDFRTAKEVAGRMQYLFLRRPKIQDGTHAGRIVDNQDRTIRFASVYFAYPGRPESFVLRSINLMIKDKESIALIGESGSGKSTILQLLLRFYDPNLGAISVGGLSLHRYKLATLRGMMGIVSQEPVLFKRTIYDNIAYGENTAEISMEQVINAAKSADIHQFIVSLPAGYLTHVGHFSSQLSAGQKQKIAIARALIRNPKILLLDEATSALDPESERSVQETLDRAMTGRTTITVSHKPEAVVNADTIYVLREGKITEHGTHDELMKLKGFYYAMRTQKN